ncbi:MAG: TonB-dependent receptor [Gammaproteobacteria bacterium]|nr:TonB-dependent receptor [Gammaproteobacteria bacterium]
MKLRISFLLLAFSLLLLSSLLSADEEPNSNLNDNNLEEVIVSAHPFSHLGLTQSSYLLVSEALARAIKESLGATLESLPGVQNNAFGTVVGRPVIHGLDGPRIKVLTDGISTMDLGVSYVDHPLLANTFTAESIELINGATSLMFGSGAIGGVINVVTGRLPDKAPSENSTIAEFSQLSGGSVSNLALRQNFILSQNFLLHFDGFVREGEPYEIPECPESEQFLEQEEQHDEEDEDGHEHEHELDCSVLANSDYSLESGSAGFSIFGERSSFSTAVSLNQGSYGVPLHFDHHSGENHDEDHDEHEDEDHHEDEHHDAESERVEIDLNQNRIDFNANLYPQENSDLKVNIKFGISQYEHAELEEHEIVTFFTNDGDDFRTEITLPKTGKLSQIYGLHQELRDFTMRSDHVFAAERSATAVFALYRWQGNERQYEFGLRYGTINDDTSDESSRDFSSYSLAGGVLWNLTRQNTFSVNSELSTRAPVIEELYIDGIHLATNSIEHGDPNLSNEQLFSISSRLHYSWDRITLDLTGYVNWFDDFIYSVDSGIEEDHRTVFQSVQNAITFRGFDTLLSSRLVEQNNWNLNGSVSLDVVTSELDDSNDSLPRQPPTRFRVGLDGTYLNWTFGGEFTHVAEPKDLASYELPTPGWHNLRLYGSFSKDLGTEHVLEISLQGNNLTNKAQRLHVSPVKDQIVQRGRFFKLSIRITSDR